MSGRITKKRLENAIENLNAVFGMDSEPYTQTPEGLRANEGVFVLDIAYGGYAVGRMSPGGGQSCIINRGTARETWDCIQSYMSGARMMHDTLEPRYLIKANAREHGADGIFESRNFIFRASVALTGGALDNAAVEYVNSKGFSVRRVEVVAI